MCKIRDTLVTLAVKNLPTASAGDLREGGLIPGCGRSPREGNGNPLQSSCLQNPMNRGAWRATVHEVAKSWTRLSDFTFTFHSSCSMNPPFYPVCISYRPVHTSVQRYRSLFIPHLSSATEEAFSEHSSTMRSLSSGSSCCQN